MTIEVVKIVSDGWTVPLPKPKGMRIILLVSSPPKVAIIGKVRVEVEKKAREAP